MLSIKALVSLMPAIALCDFQIYAAQENDITGGGGSGASSSPMLIFPSEPACDTPYARLDDNYDDLTEGDGYVCDGCDASKSVADWQINSLQLNDDASHTPSNQFLSEDLGFITLYPTPGVDGSYDIDYVKSDGSSGVPGDHGHCTRDSGDTWGPCGGPLSETSAVRIFICTSQLTVQT